MKKVLYIVSTLILAASSVPGIVQGQTNPLPVQSKSRHADNAFTQTIDDVQVPHALLEYIQYFFPGHAVTRAEKLTRNGQDLYRLRVDRDDVPSDYSSFLMVFDHEWRFIRYEKQAPPPEKKPVNTQVKPQPKEPRQENREDRDGEEDKPSENEQEQPTVEGEEPEEGESTVTTGEG